MTTKLSLTASLKAQANLPDTKFLSTCVVDWRSIEEQFQSLLDALTDKNINRATSEASLAALVQMVLEETNRLLEQGLVEEAMHGATVSLRYAETVHGKQSAQLVPCHLAIAKANYALQKFKKAEQFLSMANWGVVKHPSDVLPATRAELQLYFGLLFASTKRLNEAVEALSHHVYYTALDHGPFGVPCSTGYLQLGNVFAAQNKMDAAMNCFETCERIWSNFMQLPERERELTGGVTTDDAVRCLSRVLDVVIARYGKEHLRAGEMHDLLGSVFHWCGDSEKAREHLVCAYEVARQLKGEQDPSVKEIMDRIIKL